MAIKKSKKKRPQLSKTTKKSRRFSAKPKAKKAARKKAVVKKKSVAKKSAASKRASGKKKSSRKKTAAKKARSTRRGGRQSRTFSTEALELQQRRARSAGQSGDLQGLSASEGADSESVDELLEEGNSFEAGVVAGVEDSGDDYEKEIRTREVPEDDVPGEYLDKD